MSAKTWIETSESALVANLRTLKKHVAPSGVMAVVKANAYGHGLEVVSQAIVSHVDWFGVDTVNEAVQLRLLGLTKPILVLGYVDEGELYLCQKFKISFVAYNKEMLRAMKKVTAAPHAFRIHIKIETGTSRQGIEGKELDEFVKLAISIPSVDIEGVSTHYANIEDTTDASYARLQLERFRESLESLREWGVVPKIRHTASSAASLLYPETRFDLIRLGISLYGHWPSKETQVVASGLKYKLKLAPALTWKTRIVQVKRVKKGTPVSYGLTERVTRPSTIAVLPIGYWDGYDRRLSGIGVVLVRGRRAKILGRICMNMMVVDVTDVPDVELGDEVVLVGKQGKEQISAEDIASKFGSIQYELLSRINPLIERRLVK